MTSYLKIEEHKLENELMQSNPCVVLDEISTILSNLCAAKIMKPQFKTCMQLMETRDPLKKGPDERLSISNFYVFT